jgi:cell division septum initiation protein DivIVA
MKKKLDKITDVASTVENIYIIFGGTFPVVLNALNRDYDTLATTIKIKAVDPLQILNQNIDNFKKLINITNNLELNQFINTVKEFIDNSIEASNRAIILTNNILLTMNTAGISEDANKQLLQLVYACSNLSNECRKNANEMLEILAKGASHLLGDQNEHVINGYSIAQKSKNILSDITKVLQSTGEIAVRKSISTILDNTKLNNDDPELNFNNILPLNPRDIIPNLSYTFLDQLIKSIPLVINIILEKVALITRTILPNSTNVNNMVILINNQINLIFLNPLNPVNIDHILDPILNRLSQPLINNGSIQITIEKIVEESIYEITNNDRNQSHYKNWNGLKKCFLKREGCDF